MKDLNLFKGDPIRRGRSYPGDTLSLKWNEKYWKYNHFPVKFPCHFNVLSPPPYMTTPHDMTKSKIKISSVKKGDRNLGKKAFGSTPQRFCPHNYSQPHWILYQLLQGGQLCQLAHAPKNVSGCFQIFPKMFQDAYFESVIAVNLTSMLVLVALFVQVAFEFENEI